MLPCLSSYSLSSITARMRKVYFKNGGDHYASANNTNESHFTNARRNLNNKKKRIETANHVNSNEVKWMLALLDHKFVAIVDRYIINQCHDFNSCRIQFEKNHNKNPFDWRNKPALSPIGSNMFRNSIDVTCWLVAGNGVNRKVDSNIIGNWDEHTATTMNVHAQCAPQRTVVSERKIFTIKCMFYMFFSSFFLKYGKRAKSTCRLVANRILKCSILIHSTPAVTIPFSLRIRVPFEITYITRTIHSIRTRLWIEEKETIGCISRRRCPHRSLPIWCTSECL